MKRSEKEEKNFFIYIETLKKSYQTIEIREIAGEEKNPSEKETNVDYYYILIGVLRIIQRWIEHWTHG